MRPFGRANSEEFSQTKHRSPGLHIPHLSHGDRPRPRAIHHCHLRACSQAGSTGFPVTKETTTGRRRDLSSSMAPKEVRRWTNLLPTHVPQKISEGLCPQFIRVACAPEDRAQLLLPCRRMVDIFQMHKDFIAVLSINQSDRFCIMSRIF